MATSRTPKAAASTASPDTLQRYRDKRDFSVTSEPQSGKSAAADTGLRFVIQKHAARRLHYDFRLELDGTLKSWAVPKGPSLDPADKRMAVEVEDHPLDYANFEGVIPPKQYGAGTVIVWDRGTWRPIGDARNDHAAGRLKFELLGEKLQGRWTLVRMHGRGRGGEPERQTPWLLIKERDAFVRPAAEYDVVAALPDSVLSGAEAPPAPPQTTRVGKKKAVASARQADPGLPEGAAPAALPLTLAPQLATLVSHAPSHGDWCYEIKFDGYRLLARIDAAGEVRLFTRNGHDWTSKLRSLARQLGALGLREAWLDGEIVVTDDHGVPDFQRLQNAFDAAKTAAIEFFVFDAPYLAGHDLRAVPLRQRRDLLRSRLDAAPAGAAPQVRFSEEFAVPPEELLHTACALRMEGLIGKRADAPYTSARSPDWVKLKCTQRQEFVIGGYTEPQGSRTGLGAVLVGVHGPDGALRYAGKVGSGFDQKGLQALRAQLDGLRTDKPAFERLPAGVKGLWVKPSLVAEVSFAQWTRDGHIRHAVFHGLRSDKPARSVTLEQSADAAALDKAAKATPRGAAKAPATAPPAAKVAKGGSASSKRPATPAVAPSAWPAGLRLTHGSRVIDASTGLTKADLAAYYQKASRLMLSQLRQRPVSLVRGPQGIGGELFFQKHGEQLKVPGIHLLDPALDPGHPPLLEVATLQALLGAVQMNVIEFHTWNARVDDIDRPDRMCFDLDPGEGVPWQRIQEAAQLVRALLTELSLQSFLKTSGGKGLHVVVPFKPSLGWDEVKSLSQRVVQHLARTLPDRFSAKSGPRNRVGKIFADYLRNGRGATTAAAWTARARPGMGISVPVHWDELDGLTSGAHWTLRNIDPRLAETADPWPEAPQAARQTLKAALRIISDEPL